MKRIIVILLAVFAGVCFGVALSTHLLITGALNKNYRAYIVQSGSMAPALPAGAIVFTRADGYYGKGDIITFPTSADTLTTHRIHSVEFGSAGEPVFVTKGDANEEPDNFRVTSDKIVGQAFLHIPYLGYFADFVRTPKGFVILVVIPASIIVYEELKTIMRVIRQSFPRRRESIQKDSGMTKVGALIPVIGVAFLFLSQTGSFFRDKETSLTNILGAADTYAELKINEFVANAGGDFPDEWVEIYNNGPLAVNLSGWELIDFANASKNLSGLGIVNPGEFVVYEDSGDGWLNNSGGETILLRDPSSVIIDSHTYVSAVENISIGRDTDGTGSFKTCTTTTKGTSNNGSC
jgi:signal peptidase I